MSVVRQGSDGASGRSVGSGDGPALHAGGGVVPQGRARLPRRPAGAGRRVRRHPGRGGPGDEHSFYDERLAWEQRLGRDGWTCIGWPAEHGGRGAAAAAAGHLVRGVRPRRRAGPARSHRRGPHRADDRPLRLARAAAAVPARHPGRHRAVVPGLQRARRRQRPGQHRDPGRPRRRRVGAQRPEGLDVAGRVERLVLRARPHRPRRAEAQGHLVPADPHGHPGHRDPSHRAGDRHRRVRRGLLQPTPAPRPTSSSAA